MGGGRFIHFMVGPGVSPVVLGYYIEVGDNDPRPDTIFNTLLFSSFPEHFPAGQITAKGRGHLVERNNTPPPN